MLLLRISVRCSILLACLFAAGCGALNASRDQPGEGSGSESGSGSIAECELDIDCAPAGTDCCACPTYAIPVTDPAHVACEDVPCQPDTCSDSDLEAACHDGACVLTCAAINCPLPNDDTKYLTCDGGFAFDANGCLTCACGGGTGGGSAECVVDTDCTRVEADCCGCALGGTDTAVPNADVAMHQQQLDCPANPACPGVDTCATGLAPACVEGVCALIPAAPADECGLTGDPPCPAGEVCELNVDQNATEHGAGVCQAP